MVMCMPLKVREIRASGVRAWWTAMSGCCWPLMTAMLWVIMAGGMTWVAAADVVTGGSPFAEDD
jgi:hypothetical protein